MGLFDWIEKTFVPEKAKEFVSKPFRTLESIFVPEDPVTRTVLNMALGAVPVVGPALATGFGALAGTKNVPEGGGFSEGFLPVAGGALSGYGLGGLGAGVASGIGGLAGLSSPGTGGFGAFLPGFSAGVQAYNAPVSQFMGGLTSSLGKGLGNVGQGLGNIFGLGTAGGFGGGMQPIAPMSTANQLQTALSGGTGLGQGWQGLSKALLSPGGLLALGTGAASLLSKPPTVGKGLEYSPEEYIKQGKAFAEKYGLEGMPEYAQREVQTMVEAPLEATPDEVAEEARADLTNLARLYTAAGGVDSSDYRRDALRVVQEAKYKILDRKLQTKQWAITTAATQGQFEAQAVYQLADMIGTKDEINNAIKIGDYESFQTLMGQLMSIGVQDVIGRM